MFIYDLILVVEPFSINVLNRDLAAERVELEKVSDCPDNVDYSETIDPNFPEDLDVSVGTPEGSTEEI